MFVRPAVAITLTFAFLFVFLGECVNDVFQTLHGDKPPFSLTLLYQYRHATVPLLSFFKYFNSASISSSKESVGIWKRKTPHIQLEEMRILLFRYFLMDS